MHRIRELLSGAVDMHVHCSPDTVPRSLDALDAARQAAEAGLAALVLKSHAYNTAPLAAMVEKAVGGIRVLGSLVLNRAVGGLNPEAVRAALSLGAKLIWMPTISAANHQKALEHSQRAEHLRRLGSEAGGLSILGPHGMVLPEVVEIVRLVRDANAVLATGHLGLMEVKALVDCAHQEGLKRIVVTHPELDITWIPDEEQKKLVSKGAFFERCWFSCSPLGCGLEPRLIAQSIRQVGAQSTILSSDMGQAGNPSPVKGLAEFLEKLMEQGINPQELQLMSKHTPKKLLDLG